MKSQLLTAHHKKIGMLEVQHSNAYVLNEERYSNFIRVLYLPAGYTLTIDFKQFTTRSGSLFFINANQYFALQHAGSKPGVLLYYNRDFYCVQIHDEEVACDGLLFNNIFEIPALTLGAREQNIINGILGQIREEFATQLSSREEMIRTYLKQIIIRATRLWKQQHRELAEPSNDMEFFRNFNRLVEIHFREKHGLADYAGLLAMTPKTLNKKLARIHVLRPNDLIKDRILLEAKRLLAYTPMSIKEIAYHLGYEDPAYFNRLFTLKNDCTPAAFRKQYLAEEVAG
ncbi:helix-turn-helix domain-containing protein [Taibaiella koreensis]|uniref:helix-turn-helix domain-containing protein n=1 Tax=Taibaiella koreensis TaxID=1268548 RepID=UPI000E59C6AD|nr:AraC family transcriptional regulator [Taibaiella koreensis]